MTRNDPYPVLPPDADDGGDQLATWLAHTATDDEVARHAEDGWFDRHPLRTELGR